MKQTYKLLLVGACLLALFATATSVQAAAAKTEDQLIADLASPKEATVIEALAKLEKEYPISTKGFPAMKKLLTDSRPKVHRKAARVLGALHADVSADDIKNICTLLKSSDAETVIDGLKALRGLKAPTAVAEVTPLLKHANKNVIRDACRTLAAIADKSVVPSIEPLLTNSDPAVKKDALDAINTLKAK